MFELVAASHRLAMSGCLAMQVAMQVTVPGLMCRNSGHHLQSKMTACAEQVQSKRTACAEKEDIM